MKHILIAALLIISALGLGVLILNDSANISMLALFVSLTSAMFAIKIA